MAVYDTYQPFPFTPAMLISAGLKQQGRAGDALLQDEECGLGHCPGQSHCPGPALHPEDLALAPAGALRQCDLWGSVLLDCAAPTRTDRFSDRRSWLLSAVESTVRQALKWSKNVSKIHPVS